MKIGKQSLIKRMIEQASTYAFLRSGRGGKPGEQILRMSDEEREVLKTLTAEDLQHRPPEAAVFYEDEYYETLEHKKKNEIH